MNSPDSPKPKPTPSPSSHSPPVQESPVFSFINNLSPIKTVKATHIAPGFPGLNSPPLVFTSPRLNPYSETSFLKSAGLTEDHDEGKKFADGPVDPVKPSTHLITPGTGDCRTKKSVETYSSSSSECVDEFLADSADGDCVNSDQSVDPCLEHSSSVLEPSRYGLCKSDELTLTLGNKIDDATNSRTEAQAPCMISEQAHEYNLGKETLIAKPSTSENQRSDELPFNKCKNIESGLPVDNAFRSEYHQDLHDQGLRGESQHDYDYSPQSLAGALHIGQVYDDENAGSIPNRLVENAIMHAPKRRCLRFEEVPHASTEGDRSLSLSNEVSNSEPPTSNVESEIVETSHVNLSETSTKRQMETSLPPRGTGKSCLTVCKPSGIGLHLNSIVNAASVVSGAKTIRLADRYTGVQVMNSASISVRRCPNSLNVVERDSVGAVDWRKETETSVPASSATTQSPHSVEYEHHGSMHEVRISDSRSIDSNEECDQSSPYIKRKRAAKTIDSDGCKRCKCKKTKCLKLYCDCFSAGIYCDTTCACQECFNRPQYEDMVLETRQKIELRNPLAFAPKIVEHEDEKQVTPASARHKRGCNCKKSMCLKKYCECYQANVGCSYGCRCEGCQNTYGKRGESVEADSGVAGEVITGKDGTETRESIFDKKLQTVATRKDSAHSPKLTPLTPSLQWFDDKHNLSKSRVLPAICCSSSRSALTIISHYEKSTRSPQRNSEKSDNHMDTSHCLSGISLHSRSSPVTPMHPLGEMKSFQGFDSEKGHHDVLQDDTPEILKDTSNPIKSVKVSSPNKKRVSPPHSLNLELGTSTSGSLRSGRKFILRAVPSFPPLTPCIGSKGRTIQNISDPLQDKD
ncbi:protein tesmin/TSO1-like CXC 2 isoform X2 [Argentina anserina]|uniref:protein tesmin/TSO1-like CXC 2 isoform X2 n=1 Tax=Argentina anserina TaxID=57926 RepID=UPI0021768682|nr:protein tesmin/TSO1-like CXC 2 isoform X2 [Potentilla anserina]